MRGLSVLLGNRRVGSIALIPGERTLFSFEEDYIADPHRPVLSQSYLTATGQLRHDTRPTKTRLAPWFSNLLPEGRMREYLASLANVNSRREFDLLRILGGDLPGAVRILPDDEEAAGSEAKLGAEERMTRGPLRFSLAGVQLKFSALIDRKGGLTIPASGMGGDWIVKLPSLAYASVPENEAAMLTLASKVGIEVPEHRLAPLDEIHGLPELGPLAGTKALVVRRFDRSRAGRIHMEDLAQVFGIFPEDKYEKVGLARIAEMIGIVMGNAAAQDFIGRLVFTVLTGNGDMHLKNWTLLYPDGKMPRLSPAYDLVSTVPYLPGEHLALNLAGEKAFDRATRERFERLAEKAALPVRETAATVACMVDAVRSAWPEVRRESEIPREIAAKIEEHMNSLPLSRER